MVKWGLGTLVAALSLASGSAWAGAVGARDLTVVELVDLTCERCTSFAPFADQVAAEIRAGGGTFRVAPVGPLAGVEPTPAVSAVYAVEVGDDDVEAQRIADALFRGFQAGAELSTTNGILSWLQLQVSEFKDSGLLTHDENLGREHLYRALRLGSRNGLSELPALVFMKKSTGAVVGVSTWKGDAPATLGAVEDLIKKLTE